MKLSSIFLSLVLLVFSQVSSDVAFASIKIGLSGSSSNANFSLETRRSRALSTNISVGLWRFLHVGLTHRRAYEFKSGLVKGTDSSSNILYLPFEDSTQSTTNSIDLTVFLHQGVVSPFIFGGVARRDYVTEISFQDQKVKSTTSLYPVPNYGVGAAVRLSMNFTLNLTHTLTPGVRSRIDEDGNEQKETVNDSHTQIGVSYTL